MEYKTKKYNEYYPFTPESNTLNKFLYSLDDKLLSMEQTIIAQKEEIETWRKDYWKLQNEKLQETNKSIAHVFKAILAPTVEVLNPASVMILMHIKENCQSIKEVRAYIDDMIARSQEQNALSENEKAEN